VPGITVELNKQEQQFVDKVLAFELKKQEQNYISVMGNKMVNIDHVVNLIQYKEVNSELYSALSERNFALASARNEQLFYVYDNNQYQYIPNFITTDLYLQVLHKYLSSLMQTIEKQKLVVIIDGLMENLYKQSANFSSSKNKEVIAAGRWANTYLAIGLSALRGSEVAVDGSMTDDYHMELEKVNSGAGKQSVFLKREIIDYTQFIPRGNYTASDTLKRYFRCVKWLNTAPMVVSDNERFYASLLLAFWIKNDPGCLKGFNTFNAIAGAFSGDEDNYAITHLIKIIDDHKINSTDQLFQKKNIESIRKDILSLTNINKIRHKAGNELAKKVFAEEYILFSAGRYTFDSEIFSRLVHILRPEPKRTFPKALDLFAVIGNKTAEKILFDEYNEAQKWPAYADSLEMLKNQFGNFSDWNKSLYNKTLECINRLNDPAESKYPLFMQTDHWGKKSLYTSLAAYTELKHDMVLYSEQPWAAEAGEGGGPPPPEHVSFVEPNICFWYSAIELLNYQERLFKNLGLLSEKDKEISFDLKELATFLLSVSQKEINKIDVSAEEFDRMTWLGGEIERLTFSILDTDHLPEREKKIALVTDIYTYNNKVLEEAVGFADEIYIIAEINGDAYLTKGACFSYYEFNSDTRLTDEKWQEVIDSINVPMYPKWIQPLYVKTKSLESKPGYSF
jgi:hypothetical protein